MVKWVLRATWMSVVCLVVVPPARAGNSLEPKPSSVNYLQIADEAADQIGRIGDLVKQRKWRDVIDICQKHLADPPAGVVELRQGVYGSARDLCNAKLAAAPPQVHSLYRTLFDPEAETLYRHVREDRDLAAAEKLVDQFAHSSYGERGLCLLASIRFERGEMLAALDLWLRWMDRVDPANVAEVKRRTVAAKCAVAAARAGNARALERAVELFGPKGTVVRVGDRELARAEELRALARGVASGGRKPRPKCPSRLDLVRWRKEFSDRYNARLPSYYSNRTISKYTHLGQLAGGTVYVNGADGPMAFDALTGRRLWARPDAKNYTSDYYRSIHASHFYCRVSDPVAGQGERQVYVSGGARLGAHDAATGRTLWAKNRATFVRLKEFAGDDDLRVAFSSPVLACDEAALAMIQTSRSQALLAAFDRIDGGIRWHRVVGGSAPLSSYRIAFPSALIRVGSSVVFCNGMGIIGRCDARSGKVRWLVPYRRDKSLTEGNFYNLSHQLRYAPIARVGGSVVCAPSDSQLLLCLRVSDGKVLWKESLPVPNQFLGALPPTKPGGPHRLFVVDTQVRCLRSDSGKVMWTWPLPEHETVGLGSVTADGIAVGTHKAIYVLDAASGELRTCLAVRRQEEELVNVVADAAHVAAFSKGEISVVGAADQTDRLIAERLADRPDDPWVLAARARLLRKREKNEDALKQYRRAIDAARQKTAGAGLADRLQRELVGLQDALIRTDWESGRRTEAFRRMSAVLHDPRGVPYSCKLGLRRTRLWREDAPHQLVTASGDRLSGELSAITEQALTFIAAGETWRFEPPGVRHVALAGHGPGPDSRPVARYVKPVNGDRISYESVTLEGEALRVDTGHGVLQYKLEQVAFIGFGGGGRPMPEKAVYVKLRNGDEVSGVITSFDGNEFVIDVPFSGRHKIPADEVYTISNRRHIAAPGPTGAEADLSREMPPVKRAVEKVEKRVVEW
ncbi:MAG: PQQ-binding-like beta-propeller repeat protein [Planctomycetota bacterium]